MVQKRRIRLFILIFSTLWYILSLLLYRETVNTSLLPESWFYQVIGVTITMYIGSVLIFILRFRLPRVIILIIKTVLTLIIAYPLSKSAFTAIMYMIIIHLEAILYLEYPYGIITAIIQNVLLAAIQGSGSVWGEIKEKSGIVEYLMIHLFGLFIITMGTFLSLSSRRTKMVEDQLKQLDTAVDKIMNTNLDYQKYAIRMKKESAESERMRLTRELHDIIGYTLANQLMLIQAALSYKQKDRKRLNDLLIKARDDIQVNLQEARQALRSIRNSDFYNESDLEMFIHLAKTFEEVTGIKIFLHTSNIPDQLDSYVKKVLYRIIQESMTNSFRHSDASEIHIQMYEEKGGVRAIIRDNGKGSKEIIDGIGLTGMRERVELASGTISIDAILDGFRINCWVPMEDLDDKNSDS